MSDHDVIAALKERLLKAVFQSEHLGVDVVSTLSNATGIDELPIDLLFMQAREIMPGSISAAETAKRMLAEPDALACVDRLISLGLPTPACIEIAMRVLAAAAVRHPLTGMEVPTHDQIFSAFDVKRDDAGLRVQLWDRRTNAALAQTVLLLDVACASRSWILGEVGEVGLAGAEVRVAPLARMTLGASGSKMLVGCEEVLAALATDRCGEAGGIRRIAPPITPPSYAIFDTGFARELLRSCCD